MVYGILQFINFAHADIVVLGAWLSLRLSKEVLPRIGINPEAAPWWAGLGVLLSAMALCSIVGFVVERVCYKPLRRAPRLNVLITAIGVSLLLQNVGQLPAIFGTQPQRMPSLLPNTELFDFTIASHSDAANQRLVIGLVDVVIFVTAGTLMVLLEMLIYRTKVGTAMRAVSFHPETAALMGIHVDRIISLTFIIGSALAAAAGFLYSMKYPGLNQPAHAVWVLLGLKAFVAAVIGGIGNVRGAVLGGFTIAFVEQFGAFYISSNYRDFYVFALLIGMLLIRPTGLLGSTIRQKV
jgi:branched-chain amino acid transport system permease protein